MKLTITSQPSFSEDQTILIVAKADLYTKAEGLKGNLIIPLTLMSVKKQPAILSVGQPMYKNKDGKKKVSFYSVHMDHEMENSVKELVSLEFVKEQARAIAGTDTKLEFERVKTSWVEVQKETDDDFIREMTECAENNPKKGTTTATQKTATASETVDTVLGM